MRSSIQRKLRLAALLAALAAAGVLAPLTYQAYQARNAAPHTTVGAAPAPLPAPEPEAVPAPPPGTEVVPAEESETDRGPASASPAGPTLSFGRAAGLHLAPDPLRLNSSAALVVDQASGEVLVQKNDQAVLPIASLTKLMTSLVVLEAQQPMGDVLTITEDDVDTERNSRSRLRVGTTLTRQEALHLALMSSENRAAHALGRTYPGGLAKMVETMNARAQALGMKNSSFVDPTGLSNANKSTARDLALLVKAAARNPLIAEYSTTPHHVASLGSKPLQYINSNRLVRRSSWDIDLQKTGYIVEAGRCLTMVTEVAGRSLVMVLLDAESNGQRLADAERLRRWAVAQWGGPEAMAELKAETAPRKVPSARKKGSAPSSKVVTAKKKDPGKEKATVAKKKSSAKEAVASKKDSGKESLARKKGSGKESLAKKKDGRVSQTFAASKDTDKS